MPETKTVYLMDASAFIHRAFHALGNISTRDGRPTGAIFGFANTLIKLVKDKDPGYIGIAFDGRSSAAVRKKIYPDYKANRPPADPDLISQMGPIHQIVEAFGYRSLAQEGYEADDLIAAYARKFKAEGHRVVIVSGDKDFYQLLSEDVSMYDPDSTKKSALTLEGFKLRFPDITPEGFLEMQALMGDSSDNIPGVKKVGEKTALKLIQQYRDLDGLYGNVRFVKSETIRKTLIDNKDNAYISRKLAYLGDGVEPECALEDFAPKASDRDALRDIFTDLEFSRLSKEFQGPPSPPGPAAPGPEASPARGIPASKVIELAAERPAPAWTPAPPPVREGGTPGDGVDRDRYVLVAGEADWEGLEKALREAADVAVDLETDDILPSVANIVGISLSTAENVAYYIPIAHQALEEGESNQDLKRALGLLRDTLLNGDKGLHGQNAKFDWLILARNGLRLPPPAGDPMLASYLLDPDTRHDLDYLSLTFLNHRTIAYGDVVPGKKSGFQMVGLAAATRYSGEDSDLALRLSKVLGAELGKDPALDLLYRKIELPLEDLLVSMEQAGILVDMLALKRISNTLGAKLEGLSESIFRHAGRAFNISSPRQVGTVLFGSLGLVPTKKTAKKTSYSTDNEVLNDIVLAHPIVPELLEYRELMKLKNTYADKLPLSINPRTGRIHTSFNQTLAVTGRLSSSNPNLQNIPAKTEIGRGIREAFLAKEGYVLVSADYSQIELRVMAEFSGDQNLLQAFLNDRDVHRETAAGILGVAPEAVGPEERRKAKAINFGIIYGQGPFGLAKTLKVSQAEARDFIALYFRRFPGVRAFMEATKAEARRSMMVTTLLGRRRYLKNISAVNHQLRSEAERMAINTPIQGSAADLIKIAMLRADARLKREGLDARLLLQVHDELIVEAKEDQADQVRKVLEEEMVLAGKEPFFPGASALKVPLKVDASVSRRWTHA